MQDATMSNAGFFFEDYIAACIGMRDTPILHIGHRLQNDLPHIAPERGAGADIAIGADYDIADQARHGVDKGRGIDDWDNAVDRKYFRHWDDFLSLDAE